MESSDELKLYKCLPVPRLNWKDVYELHAIRMALVHNIFIRGYNSMLYYSGQVEPATQQFRSFLSYCATMNHALQDHHQASESIYFPFLEEKFGAGSMDSGIAAHRSFESASAVFQQLVHSLQGGQVQFSVSSFRDSIHAFLPNLRDNFEHEVEVLDPEKLRKYFTVEELNAFEKRFEAAEMARVVLSIDLPLVLINGDGTNGAWFPPVPGIISILHLHLTCFDPN